MNPKAEASAIKIKNIIDVAITFSAMNRVFEKGSKQKITEKLERSFGLLAGVNSKDDFEKIHAEFCEWFIKTVYTSKKGLKKAASYGQAAIVFSIALRFMSTIATCQIPRLLRDCCPGFMQPWIP